MLEANQFLNQFINHFHTCKASKFILKTPASFESWFRAEIPIVLENWYNLSDIDTNFRYPDSNNKADLVIKANNETIVFELKSFVSHQDSNKKDSYPNQIKALEEIVNSKFCQQGIAFTTFMGYSKKQVDSLLLKFFSSNKWNTSYSLIPNSQFAFHVGSYILS